MNKDELSMVLFKREGTPPSSPSGYRPGKGGHTTATGLYMGEPERVKLHQSPSPSHESHKPANGLKTGQPIWIKAKSRKESSPPSSPKASTLYEGPPTNAMLQPSISGKQSTRSTISSAFKSFGQKIGIRKH